MYPHIRWPRSRRRIVQDFPFNRVGDPTVQDRCGWPIDHLASQCVFDWIPGDGQNPAIGPTLGITDGGGPDETDVSPWQQRGGDVAPSAYFDGTTAHRTSTRMDPSVGQDVRVIALFCVTNDRSGNFYRVFSTRDNGPGISLHFKCDVERLSFYCVDSVTNQGANVIGALGWTLADGHWDVDGNITLHVNGILVDTNPSPGGVHLPGDGVGIGSFPDGSNKWVGRIARVLTYYGSGFDSALDAAEISARVFGVQNSQGNGTPTITRASSSVAKRSTHYHVFSLGAPRAGAGEGLLIEPQIVNKVYNNINPAATTGWAASGGTMSVVDDTVALRTSGILELGPNVYRFVPGAGDEETYTGAQTGNTNKHSASVFLRGDVGGETVDIGLRDVSAGSVQVLDSVTLTTSWVRYELPNQTPDDSDMQFCLDCDTGDTIYHIGAQLEESPICSSPIPNLATAATATRAADVITTTHTPSDEQGSVSVDIEPTGWSAGELGQDSQIITRSGGAASLIRYESSGSGSFLSSDGTNLANPTSVSPADGVTNICRVRWGSAGLSLVVDNARDNKPYDGALQSSGTIELKSTGAIVRVRNLRIYRNGVG